MATEVLEIIVREKGARVVARDIAKIAVSSQSAATQVANLNRIMATSSKSAGLLANKARGAATALGGLGAASAASAASLSRIGLGATLVGGAIVAGIARPLANAIKLAGDFESTINFAGILFQVDRGTEAFERLAETSKQLGLTTQFTAVQVAEGLQFLGKAGFDANDAIKAIPSTLNIAAIAQIGLGKASNITTNILKGFGQEIDDLPKAVDTLAATVTSSNVDILQLAETFKKLGPVARQFDQDFTDINAVAGALGDAGIQAEESGTALRRIFINLEKDINKSNSILREAGVTIRDSEGKFRSIIDIFEDIAASAIPPAQAIDLFAARALAASGVLTEAAEKGLRKFAVTLDDQVGRASEVAARRLVGLRGENIKLASAIDGLRLAIAEAGLLKFFTTLTIAATKFVRIIAKAPKPILFLVSVILVLVSAVGFLALNFGLAALAVSALGLTFAGIGASALKAAVSVKLFTLALLTNPVTALVVALVAAGAALILFRDETFKIGDTTVTVSALMEEAWDRVGKAISGSDGSVQALTESTRGFFAEIADASTLDNFGANVIAVFSSIGPIIRLTLKKAAKTISLFVQGLAKLFGKIPEALRLAVTGDLEGAGKLLADSLRDDFKDAFAGSGKEFAAIVEQEIADANRLLGALGGTDFVVGAGKRVADPADTGPSTSDLGDDDAGSKGKKGPATLSAAGIDERAKAFIALKASLDPSIASQLKYLESVNVINQAQIAGIISAEGYDETLTQLADRGYAEVIARSNDLAAVNLAEQDALAELKVAADIAGTSLEQLSLDQQKIALDAEMARIRTKGFQEELGFLGSAATAAQISLEDFQKTPTEVFAQNFTAGLGMAQTALSNFIQTGEANFKEFARSILSLIADIIAQLLIQIAVEAALNAVRSSGGGGLGASFSSVGGLAAGKQEGGPVTAGSPFIVGEAGPELFVPKSSGNIVPNSQLAAAAGGAAAPPNLNVSVINVDDANSVPDAMDTRKGEQVILNVIQRNKRTVRDTIR